MALSVIKSPKGFINSSTGFQATYTNGSSVITRQSHGLWTGVTIFISDNQASGFWYVTPLSADTFNIREYQGASVFTFVGSGSFAYFPAADVAGHGWNCVHLPIVYKLLSTLWPTNSVDTARTVSSYSNDLGYARLTLSGSLGTVSELEFVKVTFTGGETAVYQILTWYSNSIVTINLPYEGGLTFVSVQKYYNDYHARIRVYAGLSSSHFFNSEKPYELITEIKAVPDSDGVVTVNINEFLKEKIEVLKNDLLKGTLQNNLDSFCQFYITYAEAYSYAEGGYTLQDYVGPYTTDSFTGYAVNAKLPFKNTYSGFLSDYIYASAGNLLQFLTPMEEPHHFNGFFDISFVNQFGALLRMKIERYISGSIYSLTFENINDYGVGIYRFPLTLTGNEDRIDLTLQYNELYSSWEDISETKTIIVDTSCSFAYLDFTWLNHLGGFDYWRFKTLYEEGVDIESATTAVKNIYPDWPNSYGQDADTIKHETSRESFKTLRVRAENLTDQQVQDLFRIKTSPLVQIITREVDSGYVGASSVYVTSKRTVIVDRGSFVYRKVGDKQFTIEFTCDYTDNLPTQSL